MKKKSNLNRHSKEGFNKNLKVIKTVFCYNVLGDFGDIYEGRYRTN